MRHWRITGNSMWPSKPEVLISLTVWQISLQFRRQTWGFWPRPERRNWLWAIATTTDNGKLPYARFARQYCNFWQSVVVAIILLIFCQARHRRKSWTWRWNFDAICQISRDVITSGFGGHIDISGCRSLLYILANIILHLYMVLYLRFVIGILSVHFSASEI